MYASSADLALLGVGTLFFFWHFRRVSHAALWAALLCIKLSISFCISLTLFALYKLHASGWKVNDYVRHAASTYGYRGGGGEL
jgi:hypothetical protein